MNVGSQVTVPLLFNPKWTPACALVMPIFRIAPPPQLNLYRNVPAEMNPLDYSQSSPVGSNGEPLRLLNYPWTFVESLDSGIGDVAWLVSAFLACPKSWVWFPESCRLGIVVHACGSSPGEVEVGGSEIQDQPSIHSELRPAWDYMRLSLCLSGHTLTLNVRLNVSSSLTQFSSIWVTSPKLQRYVPGRVFSLSTFWVISEPLVVKTEMFLSPEEKTEWQCVKWSLISFIY